MRYVIQTAISHGCIKYQITTVGSHGCIIKGNNTNICHEAGYCVKSFHMNLGLSYEVY